MSNRPTLVVLTLAMLIPTVSCGPRTAFPEDFLWGAATAGFQVEAGCPTMAPEQCEDRNSDWYQWVTDPELIAEGANFLSGDPISMAPGYWELYEADHQRAATELHAKALRISLEWSRLFPNAAAETATSVAELDTYANPEAVAGYRAILQSMVDQGLEPVVTINHYTLPLWIHDGKACHEDVDTCINRGWLDGPRIIPAIAQFARWCAATFGNQVEIWATLNEPFAVVGAGFLQPTQDRTNPPGISNFFGDISMPFTVMFNMIEAHAAMYDAIKEHDSVDRDGDGIPAQVGLVPNIVVTIPEDPLREEDIRGAEHFDYVYNRMFLDATIHGKWDRNADGIVDEVRTDLANRMDYIGVNYYTRVTVRGLLTPLSEEFPYTDFLPLGMWARHPEGIVEAVALANSYDLPVIITETGTPDIEGDVVYFTEQLQALSSAWREGTIDVRGYLVWSLVDNYEWNHGMNMRFGLYELDTASKERTMRQAGSYLADVAAQNGAMFLEDSP